jgi:hypothetical protein
MLKEGEAPTFYMALYLVNVICTRNVFININLSWNVAKLPVHVYFSILWENMYKKSYVLICDEFITRIHFIIFKKVLTLRTEMGCSKSIPRQPRTTLDWELPLPTREGSLEQCHNRNLSSLKKVGRFMGKRWS